ncbi:MAG TPA: hypothetical protein VE553_06150 [Candidatus Binatia bacterium]|jgi:hypothetical protein|nr:hypothetical protein [Candidatus Binatia bacterium]
MNALSRKLGFWSALLCTLTFVLFTICFVAILATSPLFVWTNLAAYVAYVQENNQFFKHLAQLAMLLFGPLFVLLLSSIHDYAHAERKVLARTAISFGAIFAALSGIHYFVQLSIVRHNVAGGELQGLEQFVQANPAAAVLAINMLGFTLFLGLASLFVAPVFGGNRLENAIRYSFLANGVFCLLGGVGYALQISWLVFLCTNLGMGGALLAATIALCVLFGRPILAVDRDPLTL